ncbi:hypothetical protein BTO30_12540 [Domibacillus antri]|uniref:Uncharacterized protein n=1 Tax=Domibacillus antri TaxID=1714264 RepID=A0A1Q8Q3B3_9BACI|nr:hypothetical protein [Domibacillus antri]OLN21843.1 hypothetical protein BTO30_12540 [Domibacillus antri]
MPTYTERFNLLKKDPATEGGDLFSLKDQLNDNLDKLDGAAKKTELDEELATRQVENIGHGVSTGLNVLASATPDLNAHVQPGVIYMPDGKRYKFSTAKPFTVPAADATNPRQDIIYVSSAGAIEYLAGTAAATPAEPALPSGAMPLYAVNVPAGATAIDQSMLIDKRGALKKTLATHLSDTVSHVTQVDKDKWNAASPKSNDLEILYWMGAI